MQRETALHGLKVNATSAWIGHAFFMAAAAVTALLFESLVPAITWWVWTLGTSAVMLLWLVLDIALAVSQPTETDLLRIWAPISQWVLLGTDAVVISSMWLFMPHATPVLMVFMAGLYWCHMPCQLLCSPENPTLHRIGIVGVHGSLCVLFLIKGGPLDLLIAAISAAYGLLLAKVSGTLNLSVKNTVQAKLHMETVALQLEGALKTVAQERDAKTRFIASASHDLGQPLQAANLFFNQAMRATDAAARERAAEGVRRSFASADQLLSHMLNHLRLEADAIEPLCSTVPLQQAFDKVGALFKPLSTETGTRIRIAHRHHQLFVDPMLLERALGNLVHNALTHSKAEKLLIASRKTAPDRLRIYVVDNGIGIAKADAHRVFEDFFRGETAQALGTVGFGLGLSSVKRIAKIMRGSAGLDARWLNGCAFYLEFPTAPT